MTYWWDTHIIVTRESLSLLIGRDIPLDEWMLISSLRETCSMGQEPGTEHFWNTCDECYGVYLMCSIGPSELQAYMIASKKYLTKALWKKLVESDYSDCEKKYGKVDYHGDLMRDILCTIKVPSYPSEGDPYWGDD